MRLIDADALLEAFNKASWFDNADRDDVVFDLVLDAPTIAPPPNDPLTLEELQEMEGEPVWVWESVGSRAGNWALVTVTRANAVRLLALNTNYPDDLFGVTWRAYRRKTVVDG